MSDITSRNSSFKTQNPNSNKFQITENKYFIIWFCAENLKFCCKPPSNVTNLISYIPCGIQTNEIWFFRNRKPLQFGNFSLNFYFYNIYYSPMMSMTVIFRIWHFFSYIMERNHVSDVSFLCIKWMSQI